MLNIAVLDDYARVARASADWGQLDGKAEITVFDKHLTEAEAASGAGPHFDVLVTIRERMALPRTLIERLPNLKLDHHHRGAAAEANLDLDTASERGVIVAHSGFARRKPRRARTWARRRRSWPWAPDDRHGAPHRPAGPTHAPEPLAGPRRHGAGRQDPGPAGPRPHRQADGQIRQGVRHGVDRLEPEPPPPRPPRPKACGSVEKDELFGEADVLSVHPDPRASAPAAWSRRASSR